MSKKQPPGGICLTLNNWESIRTVKLSPKAEAGLFSVAFENVVSVTMNRSELAALHAAMGELLSFYRDEES